MTGLVRYVLVNTGGNCLKNGPLIVLRKSDNLERTRAVAFN